MNPTEIKEETIDTLEALLQDESLSDQKVKHSSMAARGLYQWVNAIRTYYFTYRDSAPARNKLIRADFQLKKIQQKKQGIIDEIDDISTELRLMRAEQKAKEDEIANF